jgi:cell division protein ZapA (FtsZ GTPase activity inhibitor)
MEELKTIALNFGYNCFFDFVSLFILVLAEVVYEFQELKKKIREERIRQLKEELTKMREEREQQIAYYLKERKDT